LPRTVTLKRADRSEESCEHRADGSGVVTRTQGNYFRSSQRWEISRPRPSRSGKITDSVTPLSLSSVLIAGTDLASIVMTFTCESAFFECSESQFQSVPNSMSGIRWTTTQRVI